MAAASVAALAILVQAGGAAGTLRVSNHHIVTYAFPVGSNFSWMLPLESQTAYAGPNLNVENGMWLPLYAAGNGSATGVDYQRSIGNPPVYSHHNKTVTITMKSNFKWSTGAVVTSNDVKFFFELDGAGKHTLGEYIPGEMPDDVVRISYPGPYSFVLQLNRSYNPLWFTDNQLTWIIPLPTQAWDKTCESCPLGNAAASAEGAKRVFQFLFKQSERLQTYATNPLWRAVDGPWTLSAYDAVTHAASFSANVRYRGPTPPKIAGYKLESFTTGTAEQDALRSGEVTFGYLSPSALSEVSYFKSHGFSVRPWRLFYNEAIEFGYTSPRWGALVKQLYVRQALQHLVNEKLYISRTLGGYGLADYGPVADYAGSPYVSPGIRRDPYPYDPPAAAALLAAHGWKRGSSGADVCMRPGTGSNECGEGIRKGRELDLLFLYSTATTSFFAQVSAFQSAAKTVGVEITLDGLTVTSMYSTAGVCPSTPPCKWGLAGYAGFLWPYTDNTILPTGKNEFGKGNFWAGGYDNPTAQALIDSADEHPGLKPLYAAEDYLSRNVASLWWPLPDPIIVVRKDLQGWQHLSPYGTILPSSWYVSDQ